jgi:hypothetical protein
VAAVITVVACVYTLLKDVVILMANALRKALIGFWTEVRESDQIKALLASTLIHLDISRVQVMRRLSAQDENHTSCIFRFVTAVSQPSSAI